MDWQALADTIKRWGQELGFQEVRISDLDLSDYTPRLRDWLTRGFHGDMDYMARQQALRCDPERLVPGSLRAICVRMDYAKERRNSLQPLRDRARAYVARYARGRDYHKLMRKRLQSLALRIEQVAGPIGYRAFVDSAPVLERALAEKSGLGWIGKNTMLINQRAGSWFFLGELFTDLPLPLDSATGKHCGSCRACLDICPTDAFIGPYELDARRCISYLTIELHGSIPIEFRRAIGNRVFGCDDCNLICPWNKFTRETGEPDFNPRHGLDKATLLELFSWTEAQFLNNTAGSAIRRLGYERWRRNLAVGLGNAPTSIEVITALDSASQDESPLVREHAQWALAQHSAKQD